MTKKEFLYLIWAFVVWRLFLALFMWIATFIFPYAPSFPYAESLSLYQLPGILTAPGNFDGVHYLTIARQGYEGTGLIQAFFPLYPLLLTILNLLIHNQLLTGQIISTLSAFGFFTFLFIYVKRNFSSTTAWWTLAIYSLFPSSFYLIGVYTESIFLFLLFFALILYQKKSWFQLTLTLIALTATRITGIVLIPSLLIAYLITELLILENSSEKKLIKTLSSSHFWQPVIFISLGSLGLIFYMTYLGLTFQQPLLFFQVQDQFGASRQTRLILWPQVVWRYLKSIWQLAGTGQLFNNWKMFSFWQEFLLSICVFFILCWQLITLHIWQPLYQHFRLKTLTTKAQLKIPLELVLFSLGAYLLPPLTGNFSSMPRYILLTPALFIGFGLIKSKLLKIALLGLSTVLLILNLLLFTQGYWVA